MSEDRQPLSEPDPRKSRIVRELHDAAHRIHRQPSDDAAIEARATVARLQARADALGDPEFVTSFRAAVRYLMPGDPDATGT